MLVKELRQSKRKILVTELLKINISVGGVDTILHNDLGFGKVSAQWVPKQLSAGQKVHSYMDNLTTNALSLGRMFFPILFIVLTCQ